MVYKGSSETETGTEKLVTTMVEENYLEKAEKSKYRRNLHFIQIEHWGSIIPAAKQKQRYTSKDISILPSDKWVSHPEMAVKLCSLAAEVERKKDVYSTKLDRMTAKMVKQSPLKVLGSLPVVTDPSKLAIVAF
eukprot:3762751-Ditylum_brightwellii.AAC.3